MSQFLKQIKQQLYLLNLSESLNLEIIFFSPVIKKITKAATDADVIEFNM